MYRIGSHKKSKRRRVIVWCCVLLVLIVFSIIVALWFRKQLKPQVTIKQSTAITTKVSYSNQAKQYTEPDFTISLPSSWHALPRPVGPYQSYTWQSSDTVTDGQQIEIYEDTIPGAFAVNRVLAVTGEVDHITITGSISDNCSTFTAAGTIAKWEGIKFLCDQYNQERDVIGTSSADGINTVILKSQQTDKSHKFFFTYTDHSINPDYTVFTNALDSFEMN